MWLPTDVETHRDWHLETPLEVSSSQRVLYVHQGEIAYGIPEKDYDCVGSDDATTCIILLCRHVASGQLLVSHLDSAQQCTGIHNYIDAMVGSSHPEPEVNVSISGGILYMNDSIETLKALLSAISLCEVANCQLKMLNFSKNCGNQGLDWVQSQEVALCKNTELHSHMPKPHVMGCGFLIMTGEGERTVEVLPMAFPLHTRGPQALLRQAATLFSHNLHVVYSPDNGNVLRVDSSPSAKIFNLDSRTMEYFAKSCQLSNEDFLREWSSSPHCEPPHFVEELKQVLAWLVHTNRCGKEAVPPSGQFQLHNNEWVEVRA